jgi:hypothetical protein
VAQALLVLESIRADDAIKCSYCALVTSNWCLYLTYANRYTYAMISLLTSVVKSGAVAMEFTTLDCPTYAIAVQVHVKSSFISLFLSLSLFFVFCPSYSFFHCLSFIFFLSFLPFFLSLVALFFDFFFVLFLFNYCLFPALQYAYLLILS